MSKPNSFRWSIDSEPHKVRTKEIIAKHPEIRTLISRNPYTLLVIIFCVTLQLTLAWFLKDRSWWLVFLVAYLVGAFACHTLYVCIHECAHNLLFKKRAFNSLSAILANLPLVFPSAISFQKYHLKHHSYQGVESLDADMPYRWEAALINNSMLGKAVWLLFYPLFQMIRPMRLKEISLLDKWTLMAHSYYDTLGYHTSYTALLFRFLTDKNLSVYSRMARANRGERKQAKKSAAGAGS